MPTTSVYRRMAYSELWQVYPEDRPCEVAKPLFSAMLLNQL